MGSKNYQALYKHEFIENLMKIIVEIAQDSENWNAHSEINTELFSEVLTRVLLRYPNFAKINSVELSVLLTDDRRIQSLNLEFRNEDKPTNVLSFPDAEIDSANILELQTDDDYMYLGDIAFAHSTIAMEAKEKGIPFLHHFKHLLIHSILHLLGYNHIVEDEAEKMQNIEIELLEEYAIPSPY